MGFLPKYDSLKAKQQYKRRQNDQNNDANAVYILIRNKYSYFKWALISEICGFFKVMHWAFMCVFISQVS